MDLTFQFPMQYGSLQHQTLLLPPDTSTTEHHFCFSPATSFYLVLVIALCSSPVAYWTPSDLGSSSSNIVSFCLCTLSMGSSRQEYCGGLLFLPPVNDILSELFTMTCLFWVALHCIIHSFVELCKPLYHSKAVIDEKTVRKYPY